MKLLLKGPSFTAKLLLVLLFSLSSLGKLQAQGWYQTFPELFPQEELPYLGQANTRIFEGLVETEDMGFLTWGASNYFDNDFSPFAVPLEITLVKTDLTGNTQWTETHVSGSSLAFSDLASFTMIPSPDGEGFVAFCKTTNNTLSTFRAIQIDETGTVLNTFELTEVDLIGTTSTGSYASTTKVIKIVPSPDNTFIVLGSNYTPYFSADANENFSWIAKIDMNGNVLWGSVLEHTLATDDIGDWGITTDSVDITFKMRGLDIFPSGEIVVSGISHPYNVQFLYKYDTNGNEIWSQSHITAPQTINESVEVLAHPNGDTFVRSLYGNNTAFSRLTATGDTLWTNVTVPNFNVNPYSLFDFCVLNDGNIGILENQNYYLDELFRFSIIDLDNNYVSSGNDFPLALTDFYDLIPTSDNTMALAGQHTEQVFYIAFPFIAKAGPGGSMPIAELSGQLYIDANNNCVFDSGEEAIPNAIVSSEGFYDVTDNTGSYNFTLTGGGDYTVTTNFSQGYPSDLWTTTCDDSITVFIDENNSEATGINFGFNPEYECPRLLVDMNFPFLRPGFDNNLVAIEYENVGTLSEDSVYISVTMDSIFSITPGTNSIPFTYDAASDTYEFFIGTLDVLESGLISFMITCPIDAELGSTPCFDATILPFTRCGVFPPDWNGAEIRLFGICEADSVRFIVANVGEEDMDVSIDYSVYADDLLIQLGDIQLNSQTSMDIKKWANGQTYRMRAEQVPNFPEPSFPQVTVETCGLDGVPFSLGFVNTFPLDDDRHYFDEECVPVTGSYDPNDKLVSPSGLGISHYINSDIELEYTIRFQNTGTDTAFNVFVLDTLSEFLDINTFSSGASTHDYELSLLPGRVIRWDFPNILLPDSTTNWMGSNGAVKFSIRMVADIPQPTEIHNVAGIYFDYNAPVITEDMFVTICDECLIQTLANDGVYFDGKVLLEGPYDGAGLMTNNLQDLIPMNQPFANAPYLYDGTEQLTEVPSNMVDWVLVEARSGTPATSGDRATTTIETQAAILLSDGSIRGLDGVSGVRFVNLTSDESYHFCIRHRNHLDVLTATAMFPTENMVYDFTTGTSQALGAAQMKWIGADAKAIMYAGDFNSDGVIQTTDYDMWALQPAAVEVYDMPDANLDGVIQVSDYDKWFFNKAKVGSVEIGF